MERRERRRCNWLIGTAIMLVLLNMESRAPAQFVISEFMADNALTLKDEDGKHSDWIEIHNEGTATNNLGGWYLANDQSQLTQWQFPVTNLPSNGYFVVFASGKNRRVPGAPLHSNFKLSSSGEYLALV